MSGSKILAEIRELSKAVPVIVLTGYSEAEGRAKYEAAGISAFLSKGDGLAPLIKAIDLALGRSSVPAQAGPGSPPSAKGWILAVDDEAVVRNVLSRYLKGRGYLVTTAEDGAQALDIIKKERPDLVLLDINMPGKDGMETLKELHALHPAVPVIMVTGNEDFKLALQFVRAGAADFIKKPLNLEYLEAAVTANIRQHS
jgi:DNA-binding response OmpR family regulator